MAYGNNRAAPRPRASFITAGGSTILFRHPSLSYQMVQDDPIDEVDVSRALKLNETFLDAMPMMDNSTMEVLVDGSTITITNHILAGTMTLQVLPTTGLVGTGDFTAAAHLVIASKDSTGGIITVIRELGGNRLITMFYGTSFKKVPHLRIAGNAVVPYTMEMSYAGWVQMLTAPEDAAKTIWAVGNEFGIRGIYKPYALQRGDQSGAPITVADTGTYADSGLNDIKGVAVVGDLKTDDQGGMTQAFPYTPPSGWEGPA
jgi:hypothetical protein